MIANHYRCFFSEADSEDLVVIREVYDSDNAQEIFEMELERAIQVKPKKSSLLHMIKLQFFIPVWL